MRSRSIQIKPVCFTMFIRYLNSGLQNVLFTRCEFEYSVGIFCLFLTSLAASVEQDCISELKEVLRKFIVIFSLINLEIH